MKRFLLFAVCAAMAACLTVTAAAAEEEEVIRIIACSDFQRTSDGTTSNESCMSAVQGILGAMAEDGITSAEGFFCCGDYDRGWDESEAGVRDLLGTVSGVVDGDAVLVKGNHDSADTPGLSPAGNNDPASGEYGVYVIHEDGYPAGIQEWSTVRDSANGLREYLRDKAEECYDRPIFVLSHLPLHYSMRSYYFGDCRYAGYLLEAMNEGAERGLNIIYLFGHNHSYFYDNYLGLGSVYLRPGDSINIATEWNAYEARTLGFTYMNAGYVGYCYPHEEGTDSTLTMTLFEIREGSLTVKRYSAEGLHDLKSAGVNTGGYPSLDFGADERVYTSPDVITLTKPEPEPEPEPITYTVTFINGGERTSFTVPAGGDAPLPDTPVYNGERKLYTDYDFYGWVDADGGRVSLEGVSADMECYARYTESFRHPFTDLDTDAYYGEAVRYCLREGVMRGDGENTFSPGRTVSRAMIVTVLYRLEGEPDVSGVELPFADVAPSQWYADAIRWAYSTEVVNGVSQNAFAPSAELTREQFATVLYRYAHRVKGDDVTVPEGADLHGFADAGEVSDYAYAALVWTRERGYVGGVSATRLSPRGVATRAQMATVLYRFATCQ